MHTGNEPRSERIDIRTTPTVKRLLQQAAAASHKNVSEFLLDEPRWQAFLEALEPPAKDRPRLKRLLTQPGILD